MRRLIGIAVLAAMFLFGFLMAVDYAAGDGIAFPEPSLDAVIQMPGMDPPQMEYKDFLSMVLELGPEKTAALVFDVTDILTVDPVAHFPQTLYVLEGRDLHIVHNPQEIEITATLPGATKPGIDYHIPFANETVKDFVPARSPWPIIAAIVVASLGGMLSDELLPFPPVLKQLAAVGVGAAAGGITFLVVQF